MQSDPDTQHVASVLSAMASRGFVRGKERFLLTKYVPTDEKVTRKYPRTGSRRSR